MDTNCKQKMIQILDDNTAHGFVGYEPTTLGSDVSIRKTVPG